MPTLDLVFATANANGEARNRCVRTRALQGVWGLVMENLNVSESAVRVTADELISLARVAAITPGRPDVSCIWRWCRKGVRARTGLRVCLEHRRVGGKLFTSRRWLERFFKELAEADTAYFAAKQEQAEDLPPRDPRFGSPRDQRRSRRIAEQRVGPQRALRKQQDDLDVELEQEGL